jgi:hypothetical protein
MINHNREKRKVCFKVYFINIGFETSELTAIEVFLVTYKAIPFGLVPVWMFTMLPLFLSVNFEFEYFKRQMLETFETKHKAQHSKLTDRNSGSIVNIHTGTKPNGIAL